MSAADTLHAPDRPFLVHIPQLVDPAGVPQWVAACAPVVAAGQQRSDDEDFLEFATATLTYAQWVPRPEGFATRIMVTPDLLLGHILLDIQFRPYPADSELVPRHRALTDLDVTPDECWRDEQDIVGRTRREVVGRQIMRQWWSDEPAGPDRVLMADYVCVANRPDSPLGPVDVVALTTTSEVHLLIESMVPTHTLLLGPEVFAPLPTQR
ncbi:hypothetical protein [Mobilicoccus sp.]|uniref:hypothetical protein n=1 Tax=Mobilicoccus sp. TaxID=2034349 RepID=UPI00289E788B|nr:hypothetical protein [Mobilicoccus sp.]